MNQGRSSVSRRSVVLATGIIAALTSLSCAARISSGETGVVAVRLGSPRNVLTVPILPEFSAATVTVSGSDMATVSARLENGTARLEVPAGADRLVAIDATPDWAASAAAHSGTEFPIFATRYGGASTVDVDAGATEAVTIQRAMTQSRIVMRDMNTGYAYLAESFSSLDSYIASSNFDWYDFGADGYGRLYVLGYTTIYRYVDPTSPTPDMAIDLSGIPLYPNTIAVDNKNGRVCFIAYDGGSYEYVGGYLDGASESIVYFNMPSVDFEPTAESVMAVGADGSIYLAGTVSSTGSPAIAKFTPGTPSGSSCDLTYRGLVSYESSGLTYMNGGTADPLIVSDMTVVGGALYIAAYDQAFGYRGKVVALSTDLGSQAEVGWCGDAVPYPTSDSTQFYGARGFIGIAPGKLYVKDSGPNSSYVVMSRVVELNLSPLSFAGLKDAPDGIVFISW